MSKQAMAHAFSTVPAVAPTAIGRAAPAAADEGRYLDALQPRYAFLSESQLLSEGSKA